MNNSFFRYPYSDSIDEIPKYDDKITIITNLYGYSYCGNIPSNDISERVYYCSYSFLSKLDNNDKKEYDI